MADDIRFEIEAELEVRDAAKREIGLKMVPWNTVIETREGLEMFERGAFDDVDPSQVFLRMDHENPPTGRGISIDQPDDAGYGIFKVARTQRGDDQLTLAVDGVATGASVGFREVPGGTETRTINGRRVRVHKKVDLLEVSTTWMPAYKDAGVAFVRSQEVATVAEEPTTPEPVAPAIDIDKLIDSRLAKFDEKLLVIEERSRQEIRLPDMKDSRPVITRGEWMQTALRMLGGERMPDAQLRALEDLTTTDNIGVVPDAFLSEIVGVIDTSRPFLNSTRRLSLPASGMNIVVPVIETRPTVARQTNGSGTLTEKADIDSTATSITTDSFEAITIAGGGDLSLQLLRRSSPSFLSLYLELLAEAMSQNAEAEALDALLTSSGINGGGVIDPEALTIGAAWENGAAVHKTPTTMWMSSAAVGAFIDAKSGGGTNIPLYSTIQAGFSANNGAGGVIQGLRPIHVPALDATDTDVIVGPSSGFAWTEDGAFTLQADVPSKAGRDVALVSIFWFAPLYPAAFTGYTLGS